MDFGTQSLMRSQVTSRPSPLHWDPFGLSAAPEIFQMKLDEAINGLKGVARIMDDLLIWGEGETLEEANLDHDRNVESLLQRAHDRNIIGMQKSLNFGRKKCDTQDMCFLTRVISRIF